MNSVVGQFNDEPYRQRLGAVCVTAMLLIGGGACAQAAKSEGAPLVLSEAMKQFAPPKVEHDALRGRIWAVSGSGVMLYGARTRSLITTFLLPGWVYAVDPQGCAPELVLDWAGNAIVSSTSTPALWRIDAQTLEVERIDIVLACGAGKPPGFTGLFYVSRDLLLAARSADGALWRIDLSDRRATKLELAAPFTGACALGLTPVRDVNPYRIDELGEKLLRLCASSRQGVRQIEVRDLVQATLIDAPCSDE